jgi:hypothetical protein
MAKGASGSSTQESLFEEDFLRRTLGDVVRVPDVALTELVANAWDAGASRVEITIPDEHDAKMVVEDDGCGLTEEMFSERWMTLAYDRQRHQGSDAEFPSERQGWRRRAYGRNGQGRHALLCFGDSYRVETWRDGAGVEFEVRSGGGENPFVAAKRRGFKRSGHGTKLTVAVVRSLPAADRIREVLSAKFLHDPEFSVIVNGESLPLVEHPGLVAKRELEAEGARLSLYCVEGDSGRTKHQTGVAFWVGGRLVGEPSWVLGKTPVLDGRTRPGRRFTFVIKSDDLFDDVRPDWTGFKRGDRMDAINAAVRDAVEEVLRELLSARVGETRNEVMEQSRAGLEQLSPLDRVEVAEVVEAVTDKNPLADLGTLTTVVAGMIDAKQRSTPKALVERIMRMAPEDIEGLNRLLDEWTVRDALTVLDEIGRRLKVVETLEKIMGEPGVDELHVIHPLVLQARWLFGPEFESPTYASNVSIKRAVEQVFGARMPAEAFENPKRRPDLVLLADGMLGAWATEDIDVATGVARLRHVLVIELKKGNSTIGRKEMDQANGYVEDLLSCGLLDGEPYVSAFVVGHQVAARVASVRTVGEKPVAGRVEAITFGQLVRTANARLFRVRDQVEERYPASGFRLVKWLEDRPTQMNLLGVLGPRKPTDVATP